MARSVTRFPRNVQRAALTGLAALTAACGDGILVPNSGFEWPTTTAVAAGLDTALLAQLETRIADSYPNVNALVIVRQGAVAWEWYPEGADPTTAYDTHSITKSAIATFIGEAIEDGAIRSLDQPMTELYPAIAGDDDVDPRFRSATLRHLLAMRSGLENELTQRVPFTSTELVPRLTRLPLLFAPGEGWHYDMANSHILSGTLSRIRRANVGTWANADLFQRLNIVHGHWVADHEGVSLGWTGLYLNARDLAKLGQLYLDDGVWLGDRILPPGFAAAATASVTPDADPLGNYGLHWWNTTMAGVEVWMAAGFRHQYILIIPSRQAIVVMQSESVSLRGDLKDHRVLLSEFLVPSIN